ncbi:hypothetical protein BC830DRAFT_1077898 [Chytriomyces sp. MP71]|nr:hypothetical protein BC830DRAFT_1077898 [Chytriomyces sp. MP71]
MEFDSDAWETFISPQHREFIKEPSDHEGEASNEDVRGERFVNAFPTNCRAHSDLRVTAEQRFLFRLGDLVETELVRRGLADSCPRIVALRRMKVRAMDSAIEDVEVLIDRELDKCQVGLKSKASL